MDDQRQPSARSRLLAAAEDLFYGQGIHTTGVDAIVDHAGVALATLYNQFGGKDALVAAYLDERDRRWRTTWEAAITAGCTPTARLLAVFDALDSWWQDEGAQRGCAYVGAAAEISDPAHPAAAAVAAHKRHLCTRLAQLAADAALADPDRVTDELVIIYEGTLTGLLLGLAADPVARGRQLAGDLITRRTSNRIDERPQLHPS